MPLLIRGPGVPEGVTVDDLAINADLAPTILDAGGRDARPDRGRPVAAPGRRPSGRASTAASCCSRRAAPTTSDDDGRRAAPSPPCAPAATSTSTTRPASSSSTTSQPTRTSSRTRSQPRLRRGRGGARGAARRRCAAAPATSCRRSPDLKLKLPHSQREDGRSCRQAQRLPGPGARRGRHAGAGRASGSGPKAAGHDTAGPLRKQIRPRLLRAKRRPQIRATADAPRRPQC